MRASDLKTPIDVCVRFGVEPAPPHQGEKLGLSRTARSEVPVHGLRIAPSEGVSGWYIWAGEMSDADDFFEPSHVDHIPEVCPLALPFLSLPPGWRFLNDGDYADVWFDPDLLKDEEDKAE